MMTDIPRSGGKVKLRKFLGFYEIILPNRRPYLTLGYLFLSSQELEMKVYNVCSIAEDEFLTVNKH
jgi:hypothetical protein